MTMIDAMVRSLRDENLKTDQNPEVIIKTDRPVKSFIKSVSWRIVGTIDTMVISYFVTGKVTLAVSIGSVEVITKTFLYYCHERLWAHIHKMKLNIFSKSNGRKLEFEEPERTSYKGESSGKSQKRVRTVSR